MQHAAVTVSMEQRHARLRRHGHRARIAILLRSLGVEDGLSPSTAGQVDQKRPRRAGWLRRARRRRERDVVEVII